MSDLFTARILIVDDEPANVRLLERIVRNAGWAAVRSTTDSREAAALHAELRSDLVLLDLMMPYLDGVAVMKQLRSTIADGEFLPIVILTADATGDAKRRALDAGATDFLTKPFDRIEIVLRIKNLLETRRLYLEREQQKRSLEATVRERTERLLQSEKVATMGALLAGVAHELNNPLAVVTGQAQLLSGTVSDPVVVRRAEKIDNAARRCVRIVRNFLALARRRAPERGEVKLNDVVQEAVELLAYELRTGNVGVPRGSRSASRSPTPGPGFRPRFGPKSSSLSSRRSRPARGRAWGCRSAGASSRSMAAPSASRASPGGARRS